MSTTALVRLNNPEKKLVTIPMTGSLTLLDYPSAMVGVACDKCGRAGQYRKQNLIAWYGGDITLPDLRHEIARCERRGKMHDTCGVHYVGLAG